MGVKVGKPGHVSAVERVRRIDYHGLRVSSSGVYGALVRDGLSPLPGNCRRRSIVSLRLREAGAEATTSSSTQAFLQFKGDDGRRRLDSLRLRCSPCRVRA